MDVITWGCIVAVFAVAAVDRYLAWEAKREAEKLRKTKERARKRFSKAEAVRYTIILDGTKLEREGLICFLDTLRPDVPHFMSIQYPDGTEEVANEMRIVSEMMEWDKLQVKVHLELD